MAGSGMRALCLAAAAAVTLWTGLRPAAAQLQPPPGPITTTMKRLDQVEPRRCVNSLPGSATAVHVISEPGNYVLTGDVLGSDRKSGIQITCDGHVSLDLNGFSLIGVQGSLHGIHHTGGTGSPDLKRSFVIPHVFEQKGRISSWGGHGLNLSSLDVCEVGGLLIEDCGGAACRVASHDIAKNAIRNMKAIRCGGGGVWVDVSAAHGSGGGAGKVSLSDLHISSCSGDAMSIRCSSRSNCDVSLDRCSASDITGDGANVEFAVGGGGGGGGAGKVSFSDLHFSRCIGDGCVCTCQPGWGGAVCELRRVSVSDVDGDGIACFDIPVSFEDVTCARCGGNGLHIEGTTAPVSRVHGTTFTFDTTIFAMSISNAADVSLSSGRCSTSSQDGLHLSNVEGASLRDVRVVTAGGAGVRAENCGTVATGRIETRACAGGGIVHIWPTPRPSSSIAHEAAHIAQCGAGGLRIECPATPMSVDVSCVDSTFTSNMGAGASISCPASSPVRCSFDRCISSNNESSGVEVVAAPGSGVQCACSHLRCVHNGGGGLVVVSSDPSSTLSSGSLHVDSSVCSSNGGAGCRCHCPLFADRCVFSENGSSGAEVRVASPFDSAGSMSSCTLHRNAANGLHVSRGRYSPGLCDATDNGGNGMQSDEGCLIVDRCVCNRNGGDGLHITGTLTVSGGSMRRNGGGGIRCFDGTCRASDCVFELNGANPGITGGGALFIDCSSATMERCVCSSNTGPGVSCSSSNGVSSSFSAVECTCSSNSLDGMSLSSCFGSQVIRCVFSGNGEWGLECPQTFSGGKIESCSCTGNGGGIFVQGLNNLVISNTCSFGPLGALSVAQGNALGRIVDPASLQGGECDARSNLVH